MTSLAEEQKYFQSVHKLVFMKKPSDRITSVLIPSALLAINGILMVRGCYNMYTGKGKIEGK